MSDLRSELVHGAADLAAASDAAITKLGLTLGEFAWLTTEMMQPAPPQIALPKNKGLEVYATLYGGLTTALGNFACGNIGASVNVRGETNNYTNFAPCRLTVEGEIITSESYVSGLSSGDGYTVVEGLGRDPLHRKVTTYNTQTRAVMVRSGQQITDRSGKDDKTTEQDAFGLPDISLVPRLATMIYAIRSVTSAFDQVARDNTDGASWTVQKRPLR